MKKSRPKKGVSAKKGSEKDLGITIPEDMHSEFKSKTALEHTNMKAVVMEAIQHYLEKGKTVQKKSAGHWRDNAR